MSATRSAAFDGDAAFAYVNVFTAHANVGFFLGTVLPDPGLLLQGTGRFMRHVKLRPDTEVDDRAVEELIQAACADMRERVERSRSVGKP